MHCAMSWPRAENWYRTRCSFGTDVRFRLVVSSASSIARDTSVWYAIRRQSNRGSTASRGGGVGFRALEGAGILLGTCSQPGADGRKLAGGTHGAATAPGNASIRAGSDWGQTPICLESPQMARPRSRLTTVGDFQGGGYTRGPAVHHAHVRETRRFNA